MSVIFYILLAFAVFFTMEGITWLTHKFVMHGFLWYLHEDHHQPRGRFFEKNDAFFLIFAIPSWLCIMLGLMYQVYWVVSIGAGIAMYGAAYFIVHDIIIHQRFKIFSRWNSIYVEPSVGRIKCITNILIKKRAKALVCSSFIKNIGRK